MIIRARPPVRVLVTGFGPFPGVPHNASEAVVRALVQPAPAPGIKLFAAVIPVVWAEARRAAHDAIAKAKPHAVLHFGVSKRAAGFEIETRAFNISGYKEDHAGGARPGKRLERYGEPVLLPTLPPTALLAVLRRGGYPAQLSRSAGRYLCNAVFYWSLMDAGINGPLVSFIHMPALGADGSKKTRITFDQAAAGARLLVIASRQAVLNTRRGPKCRSL